MTMLDRAQGCLLGLAVGDAVGTTVEFKDRGTFPLVTDMVGGGPFSLKPGQWTDDTSMALCLGYSLVLHEFDPLDQMVRYVDWYTNGYMSCTGRCFDIGGTTRGALYSFQKDPLKTPIAGSTHFMDAGNGCIMRLAPVPIMYALNAEKAIELSGTQSTVTHGSDECVKASRMFGEILVRALNEMSKEEILRLDISEPTSELRSLENIARGTYFNAEEKDIRGSGYVVESLEAALWCFYTTENFKDCILKAANLGDDADTTAAIAGQVAGAYYGLAGIPTEWVKRVSWNDHILELAADLVSKQEDVK